LWDYYSSLFNVLQILNHMQTPFIFGKLAVGENFTNRKDELKKLTQNFLSGTNTMLISPRRWGKSSLVLKAANEIFQQDRSIKVVLIDLFNIRNEEEFYRVLAEHIMNAVSGKLTDVISNVKRFLKQLIPKISLSPDSQQEFSLSFDWQELKKQPEEILNLAENIAIAKGLRIIVCLDEFQNIAYFEDPLAFQKKLRASFQHHQHVTYCLYGSKRHMLKEVFASPSMPFYKFGDLMFLTKISIDYWGTFIVNRFEETGKKITGEQARKIAKIVDCHPYYVQQLAQACWLRTDKNVSDSVIDQAIETLVLQLSMLFQNITETLSNSQINFLQALLDGVSQISSKQNIEKYNLGTSANIVKVKKALIKKEIIDDHPGELKFLDPVYEIWLRIYYFI